ncbi:MAG: protoporphyrinogen oxidase [Turneriella sp.]
MLHYAIVGGGISGLSHAYFLKKKVPTAKITVFEPGEVGGNIATQTHDGVLLEPGPDSYLDRTGLFNTMISEIGLKDKLVFEDKRSAKRFILKDGYLVSAPKSPLGLITTSLLFFPEKIKIFFAMGKKFSLWPTITLFDAARNVLGFSAAEYLASPFARGVYGSEAEDLEFSSMFPDLFRKIVGAPKLKIAMKQYAQERRAFWQGELGEVQFNRGIYSFKGGLTTWVQALRESLEKSGVEFVRDKIARIGRDADKKIVLSSKSKSYPAADRVVFTIGTADSGYIFREYDKELSRKVAELKYSPINVVYSLWNRKEFSAAGYGFLAPRKERAPILGTIFASNVFPGRAPEDKFLTKTMISGDSELFKDDELGSLTEESLARIFKARVKPVWTKVFRHNPGIPRYAPGYGEWKREVQALLAKHEGVHFSGWGFSGIGLADQVESAYLYAKSQSA